MSDLLNSLAVSRQGKEGATEILQSYIATPNLALVQSHTPAAAAPSVENAATPRGAGGAIEPK